MSAILKFDFQKREKLRFSEVNYLNSHKKDPILHVTTTFSLKQGETKTSHGLIPHTLSMLSSFCFQISTLLVCLVGDEITQLNFLFGTHVLWWFWGETKIETAKQTNKNEIRKYTYDDVDVHKKDLPWQMSWTCPGGNQYQLDYNRGAPLDIGG